MDGHKYQNAANPPFSRRTIGIQKQGGSGGAARLNEKYYKPPTPVKVEEFIPVSRVVVLVSTL